MSTSDSVQAAMATALLKAAPKNNQPTSSPGTPGFVKVGKMKDAHGIRGELFIVLFAAEAAWLKNLKELRLVNDHGEPDPKTFEVKSARAHKNGLIVKTTGVKDRNEAEALKGRVLEIPEEFLISKRGESIYLREILGFEVRTADGAVGKIVKFSSNGAQDLLVVLTKAGEFEIPFVKAFVEKIDYAAKTIAMNLPVGLLGEEVDAELSVRDGQNDHLADAQEGADEAVESADADADADTGAEA